jgi:hypothetical protein
MITGHDVRFQQGSTSLTQPPGPGVLLDKAHVSFPPWQPLAQPWHDTRLV